MKTSVPFLVVIFILMPGIFMACSSDNELEEPAQDPVVTHDEAERAEAIDLDAIREELEREREEVEPETRPERATRTEEVRRAEAESGLQTLFVDEGRYGLQVAAHNNEAMAKNSEKQWRDKNYKPFVVSETDEYGAAVYRVYIGRFESASDAFRGARILMDEYNAPSFVRSVE